MHKIIFPNGSGISVIHPTGELPIEDVARKDVPQGAPFLVIDEGAVPEDRTFRSAWEADFSNPHGHGDPQGWWAERAAEEAAAQEAEIESGPPVALLGGGITPDDADLAARFEALQLPPPEEMEEGA